MRVATYLRVSTGLQTVENQRLEVERHVTAKGWTIFKEYADEGASGATTRRPALDQLMADARRRRFDIVCVAKLDRFGRSLKDLVLTLEELQSLGITFVSINEGIDLSTSVGRLQLHILAALAQWERERIIERVRSGMARAKAQGKRFGRPERIVPEATLAPVRGLSVPGSRQAPGRQPRHRPPLAVSSRVRENHSSDPLKHSRIGVLALGTPRFVIELNIETAQTPKPSCSSTTVSA